MKNRSNLTLKKNARFIFTKFEKKPHIIIVDDSIV